MKDFLKKIPLLGWFLRFLYNILRINNLKHTVYMQQTQLQNQQIQLQDQQRQLQDQQRQLQDQQMTTDSIKASLSHIQDEFNSLNQNIDSIVVKEIFHNMLGVHQRVDQFIFDSKILINSDTPEASAKLESINEKSKLFFDDYYLAFENKFRGSRENILQRYREYLKYIDIDNVSKALDIGCGRGEWVQLLQEHNIESYGIDINHTMVLEAKSYKVDNIINEDIFKFLKNIDDNSYDLITGFHIIEHIPFEKLLILLKEVQRVLKPSAKAIFETPNPKNLLVASLTFYNDPTHLNPLPPDVVKFMLEYLSFNEVEIVELNPFGSEIHIKEESGSAQMLNNLLFSEQDYLVVGSKK